MKTCNRIHVVDIERGDVFDVRADEDHRDDYTGPREFRITVTYTYNSRNFGWQVNFSPPLTWVDEYGDAEDMDCLYLNDGWRLTHVPA